MGCRVYKFRVLRSGGFAVEGFEGFGVPLGSQYMLFESWDGPSGRCRIRIHVVLSKAVNPRDIVRRA